MRRGQARRRSLRSPHAHDYELGCDDRSGRASSAGMKARGLWRLIATHPKPRMSGEFRSLYNLEHFLATCPDVLFAA